MAGSAAVRVGPASQERAGAHVRVVLPAALRELARGRAVIEVEVAAGAGKDAGARTGATLADLVAALRAEYRGVHDSLVTERGALRPHVNVFVDGENSRFTGGLGATVRAGSEVMVLPAISGG